MRLQQISAPLAAAIGASAPLVSALGQEAIISFTEVPGRFQIAGRSASKPQILVSGDDYWGVIRAAGDLAKDFGRVTGTKFTLSNGETGAEPAVYAYNPTTNNYTHVSVTTPLAWMELDEAGDNSQIIN